MNVPYSITMMMSSRDGQEEAGKIFVGGIARDVDEGILTSYFSQFGNVCLATVMRDKFGISRGFGFVAFDPPEVARDVLKKIHTIEGRTIEIKQAVKHDRIYGSGGSRGGPSSASQGSIEIDGATYVARQVYVGGLPYHITEKEVREYFEQFGPVVSANLKYDFGQTPPKFRGFGFVNFVEEDSVEKALENYSSHQLSGKWIEVKRSKHSHVVQGENSGVIMPQQAQGTAAGKGGAYEGGRAPAYQDPYGGAATRDPYGGQSSGPVRGGARGGPSTGRYQQPGGSYRASPYGGAPTAPYQPTPSSYGGYQRPQQAAPSDPYMYGRSGTPPQDQPPAYSGYSQPSRQYDRYEAAPTGSRGYDYNPPSRPPMYASNVPSAEYSRPAVPRDGGFDPYMSQPGGAPPSRPTGYAPKSGGWRSQQAMQPPS